VVLYLVAGLEMTHLPRKLHNRRYILKIAAQASRRLEPLLKKDRVVIPDTGLMGGRKTKQQEDEDTVQNRVAGYVSRLRNKRL